MIELFEGRIGAGKTYSVVEKMMEFFAAGSVVVTNIELNIDAVRAYLSTVYGWDFQEGQYIQIEHPDQIMSSHTLVPRGLPVGEGPGGKGTINLLCIDEAHCYFNARAWGDTARKAEEFLWFLTQSRKVRVDVWFISQSVLNMDKQFMRLVQYIWRFRDMKGYKLVGPIRWPFANIMRMKFDYDGRTKLHWEMPRKDKRIFALYKSFELVRKFPIPSSVHFKQSERGKALQRSRRRRAIASTALMVILPLLLFGGWYWREKFSQSSPAAVARRAIQSAKEKAASARSVVVHPVTITAMYHVEGDKLRAFTQDGTQYTIGMYTGSYRVVSINEREIYLASTSSVVCLVHDVASRVVSNLQAAIETGAPDVHLRRLYARSVRGALTVAAKLGVATMSDARDYFEDWGGVARDAAGKLKKMKEEKRLASIMSKPIRKAAAKGGAAALQAAKPGVGSKRGDREKLGAPVGHDRPGPVQGDAGSGKEGGPHVVELGPLGD